MCDMSGRTTDVDDDAWEDDADDGGPSRADIERFSGETAHCPACGAEVWDDAVTCPACFELIEGETTRRPPLQAWWRQRWFALVIVLLILAMLGLLPLLFRR